jgi:hypothetical protein
MQARFRDGMCSFGWRVLAVASDGAPPWSFPEAIRDERPPFDEALLAFETFLDSRGWPRRILWASRDRVLGHRRTVRVFRPHELGSLDPPRARYEALCTTDTSIRIDAIGRILGCTLAGVIDYGGSSRVLNLGIPSDPPELLAVTARAAWYGLRALARFRAESVWVQELSTPSRSAPVASRAARS